MNNPFGNPYIASADLLVGDIPTDASDWRSVIEFAATLDQTAEPPSAQKMRGVADVTPDSSVREMRYALFAEWRRWNHMGRRPDDPVVALTNGVLDSLRAAIA